MTTRKPDLEGNPVRIATTVQHLLPIILVAVGFLELAALVPVRFDALGIGGTASWLGPSSFLPLSLAVVWAALLPPTPFALVVKAATALGALGFAAVRVLLVALWWNGVDAMGWSTGALALSGVLLGVVLAVWAVVDALATKNALSSPVPEPPVPVSSPNSGHGASPVAQQFLPASPTTPTRSTTGVTSTQGEPHPATEKTTSTWQSVSTPWPRRDESDPDGTLIRPPRKRGHHHPGSDAHTTDKLGATRRKA